MPNLPTRQQLEQARAAHGPDGGLKEDADQAYPEQAGYSEFIAEQQSTLEAFAGLGGGGGDDRQTAAFMTEHLSLLLESAHTGRFFMLRNSQMVESGETKHLKQEARQLFLLDAACDAANAAFMGANRGNPNAMAADPVTLRASAKEGVNMLFRALTIPNDPMQLRQKLDKKVTEYIGLLVKRVAKLRKQRAEEERIKQERKQAEKLAREAEAAAKQRRQRSLGLSGTLLLFMLVLALVFFWSGSVR